MYIIALNYKLQFYFLALWLCTYIISVACTLKTCHDFRDHLTAHNFYTNYHLKILMVLTHVTCIQSVNSYLLFKSSMKYSAGSSCVIIFPRLPNNILNTTFSCEASLYQYFHSIHKVNFYISLRPGKKYTCTHAQDPYLLH